MTQSASVRCSQVKDGPKVGRHVVLWRKQCKNRTSHTSGLCHVHRVAKKVAR